MQPSTEQEKAAELVASGLATFNPMTGWFTVAGASVDGPDFYRCRECASNKCAHSLAAQVIDSAFEKARLARKERVLDEYLAVLQLAQADEVSGFTYNTLEIEIRAAQYIKSTSRGLVMPIPQNHVSIYQATRIRELGGSVVGLSYSEAKAEILRLEWNVWEV